MLHRTPIRLAYLVTHPIQYQAPLLRRLSQDPRLDLTVFFGSDFSIGSYVDPGFGGGVEWDVPLLEGYRHEFLPVWGENHPVTFWRPFNHGLARRLKEGQFDVLWIHGYARWPHWAAILAAKGLGIKVLIRDEANDFSAQRSAAKQMAKRTFFQGIRRICDGFLAIGSHNRRYYEAMGINPGQIDLVPYTVDNAFFQARSEEAAKRREGLRQELGLVAGRPVILFTSKLIARKRPLDLLQAYAALSVDGVQAPDPYLVFVGDGELRSELDQQVSALGWDSIRVLGFKNQTELPAFYDLCDVFVLPSEREPWGLVVNEVMNAGRAVVVSDQVGSAIDLVQDGVNGYSFRAGHVEGLTGALREVLAHPERCQAMGRQSLAIINGWSYEQDVTGLYAALDRLFPEPEGARRLMDA